MAIDFEAQRVKMVDGQVRTTDVTDLAIQSAMLSVPREAFVPAAKRALAYIDEDIEIAPAQGSAAPARYLMEPSPFARLVQLAKLAPSDFVLDIGCGTGYSTAVLSRIAGFVVAVESDAALAAQASANLSNLGYENVAVIEGKLTAGHANEAPYDVIIVNGAVDRVPETLLGQLRDGGRLVAVVGVGNSGRATIFVKESGVVSKRDAFNAAVRPLGEFRLAPEFQL